MPVRRVKQGDSQLPAPNLNLQRHVAAGSLNTRLSGGGSRAGLQQQFASEYRSHDPDIVKVRNDTGCDLNKFDAVGLDFIADNDDTPTYACSRPNFCRHAGRTAILIDDLNNNQIGYAAIAGVATANVPQMTSPANYTFNGRYETTTFPPMTVDAGYLGPADAVQRAIGLHRVREGGSIAVMHYDDIGSPFQDLATVKLRNPSVELLEESRSRCKCLDGSCTHKCTFVDGEYGWRLYRNDCERGNDPSKALYDAIDKGDLSFSYQHHVCSCDESPVSTSRVCDASTLGQYLTEPCVGPSSQVATVQFADSAEFCGEYCIWYGNQLIRGCDESCNSDCACISPTELGNLPGAAVFVGDSVPYVFRTPCLKIDEGGVCVHSAGPNGWTEVFNNCSSLCPCDTPPVLASQFPAGYRYTQKCNRTNCRPCNPRGKCVWRYSEETVQSGFWQQIYARWTLLYETCPGNCECSKTPPGYDGNLAQAPIGVTRYTTGDIVETSCCKSPISKCDPTTTTPEPTTTITPSTPPPGDCGCTLPYHYCEWTCKHVDGLGMHWFNTYHKCCNINWPLHCSCGRGFVQPYPCDASTIGRKAYSACTSIHYSPASFSAAVSSSDLVEYPTTTTTASPTTTSHPTVGPSTTPSITAAYALTNNSGTTIQPTCRTMCVQSSPTLNADGTVSQAGYMSVEIGTADGLCSRFGSDTACIISSPCNASTAGTVIEGICRRVDQDV